MTKPMHGGHAADAGAMAAMIAGAGVTGARDMLEGEIGFGVAMGDGPDWSQATDGLGERYNITRMTVKNHGCCGHTFAAIDGMLALCAEHALKPATVNVCGSKKHSTPFEGKFSLAYVVAQALNHGSVRLDAFAPERLNDPVTHELVEKVELSLDPGIDAMFPGQRAANLEVETTDGRVLKFHQPTRKGDPDLPLTDDDLNGKFMELTAPVTGEAAAAALLDASWRLDALTSAAELPFGGSGGALRGAAE
jgi:2-methylcitrate dehydratase PrpD